MDYKQLTEKYWAGETTLEEEKALKKYWLEQKNGSEPPTLLHLFQYYEKEKNRQYSRSIEQVIPSNKEAKITPLRHSWWRIAAAILLILAVGIGINHYLQPTDNQRLSSYWATKEIKDPKEAYRKTRAALLLVSSKLNKGTEAAIEKVAKVQEVSKFIK